LNILYVSSKKRWGGVASWMVKTAKTLQNRGHTIWILSHPRSQINAKFPKELNLISYQLGMEYNPAAIYFIMKQIRKKKIQLMVTNLEKEIGIGGIAARLAGIPNIRRIGREDDFNTRLKNKWNHRNLVFSNIVPCNALKIDVMKRAPWLKIENFKTIYNGADPVNFDRREIIKQRNTWGIGQDMLVIGITVQLLKVKRVDLLIRCFKELKKDYDNIKLVITGIGRDENNLKQLVVELDLFQDVVFAGYTQQPQLVAAAYDIAVLSSRLEGFPNTIVEYFAAGKPVVSTNVGGIPEIIVDGENGFLIEPNDQSGLIRKIKLLLDDKALRDKFSVNSLDTLKKKFTEKKMVDELENFFHKQLRSYAELH
jgi:glycosyltransferase involved in cell wall biosynthesis